MTRAPAKSHVAVLGASPKEERYSFKAVRMLKEGGTTVIPGYGRLYDETDVAEYRDMLVIIRDRIQAGIDAGDSLAKIVASRPALDYEGVFGTSEGPWSTNTFIEAIYRDLGDR